MANPNHTIARAFFAALSAGSIPDDLLTDDMTAWTISSGQTSDRARYQGGIKLFAKIFDGAYTYFVDSLTSEDDRIAAEVHTLGRLSTGEGFSNTYVFMLKIRDGKIAHVAEHFDPRPMQEKLMPLIQQVMAGLVSDAKAQ